MGEQDQSPGSITRHIDALRSADEEVRNEAAQEIWNRYFRRLSALVRTHLDQRLRRREDEDDVVQEMYHSFFRRQQKGDFDLTSRNELWQLLVTIALCKTRNTAQRHQSQRRDYRREFHSNRSSDSMVPDRLLEQMDAAGPTPSEAAAIAEEVERRLQILSEPLRQIACWKLEGHTHEEIAGLMNCSKRTVIRKVELIRKEWTEFGDTEP